MTPDDTVGLFVDDARIADITAGLEGVRLAYADAWRTANTAFPISLSLPLTAAEHAADVVSPWLMNLLPEGEPLQAATRALGVARQDVLGLIEAMGRDLAGALTVGRPRPDVAPDARVIESEVDLERIITELPARPFLVGEEGVSMSLAGAQEKLPLTWVGGRLAIPINGAASTLILKPDNSRLPGSVENEALCMVLAQRCGLLTASVTTGRAGARTYLLVKRYDRVIGEDGAVLRLHQEDFCQALGRPPAAKYEHNRSGVKGPSLPEMFAVTREHMTARDITRLLDAVIFNIAIGNVDSHAKNYSILLRPGSAELAPLYDLMSGLSWANITQNHAQDVGGKNRGRHILGRHWRRMAKACGLAGPATSRRVASLAQRILNELPAAAETVRATPAGASAMLDIFVKDITARATLVRDNAAISDGEDVQDPDNARGMRLDGTEEL